MPLHLEYRPKTLNEIVGNKSTVASLTTILDREEDAPHVYLFQGPSGCGKTTLGRIIANRLFCSEHDLREINSSNNRGIDTAREIISSAKFKPLHGPVRVFILDEIHQATKDFQNALLKILEDTPDHVYFILCTTEPDRLLKTIRSRCSIFQVAKLSERQIVSLLERVMEDFEEGVSNEILKEIAKAAEGSPRQALVILDQIIDLPEEDQQEAIKEAGINERQVLELCRALLENKNWKIIAGILKGIDEEPEKVRRAVLGYMNSVLLSKESKTAALIMEEFIEPFYNSGKAGLTFACYRSIE